MGSTYSALAAAITREENSSYLNNPGALMGADGKPLQFDSLQAGADALKNKLEYDASGLSHVYSPNMTLGQFESVYTGGDPNAGNNVASFLGVPATTPLGQLSDQSLGGYQLPTIGDQPALNVPGSGDTVDIAPNGDTTLSSPFSKPQTANANGSIIPAWASDVAAVLVGLVCIAGAVFSFSQVKETVITAAKGAAALAA